MPHLDEGTIHAWLDGALSADEALAAEAHVAECGACAEMVAEARGLIAGSSRILIALDHVPRGVIPGGAPAAPIPAQRNVRRWASRPALRAAAAVLFLAVASLVVLSSPGVDGAGDVSSEPVIERLEAPPVEAATTSADQAADASLSAGQGAAAQPSVETSPSDVAGAFSGRSTARAPDPETPQPQRFEPPSQAKAAAGAAGAPAPAAPPAPAPAVGQVAGRQAADAAGQRAIAASVPGATVVQPGRDSGRLPFTAADSLAELRRRAMMSAPLGLQEIVVTSSAQDSAAGRALRAERNQQANVVIGAEAAPVVPFVARPGVEMAGCYSVMIGNWSGAGDARATAIVPTLLRLEATTLDIALEGPRLVLRTAADTAALRPDSSYWRVNAADSLLVVWRGASPEVSLRLAIRDPLLHGIARQGDLTAPVTARRVGAVCGGREQNER